MWQCKGIRIRGWEVVGERMQLKIDNTVCGLMWGMWQQILLLSLQDRPCIRE